MMKRLQLEIFQLLAFNIFLVVLFWDRHLISTYFHLKSRAGFPDEFESAQLDTSKNLTARSEIVAEFYIFILQKLLRWVTFKKLI
jgi:hypothetical protein